MWGGGRGREEEKVGGKREECGEGEEEEEGVCSVCVCVCVCVCGSDYTIMAANHAPRQA